MTSDAKFSATVTPVNRNVFWIVPPGNAFAVRTPTVVETALGVAVRCCQIQAAPPSIRRAITKPMTRPVLEGFCELGRTISGLGACDCCGSAGAGATLIRFLGFDVYYDAKVTPRVGDRAVGAWLVDKLARNPLLRLRTLYRLQPEFAGENRKR